MSESARRQYRKFTAQQKGELVLASLRGQKTIAELCREHDISETLLRRWREQFLAAGAERLSAKAPSRASERASRQLWAPALDDLRAPRPTSARRSLIRQAGVSSMSAFITRKAGEVATTLAAGFAGGHSCSVP